MVVEQLSVLSCVEILPGERGSVSPDGVDPAVSASAVDCDEVESVAEVEGWVEEEDPLGDCEDEVEVFGAEELDEGGDAEEYVGGESVEHDGVAHLGAAC